MQKQMNENLMELVGELEYLIGSECYNPNSYDGYADIEGCSFRYPVTVPDKNGDYQKIRYNINTSALLPKENRDCESYEYMKYRFGSNQLYVGKAILNVLGFLEERYGLDFDELEEKYRK